MGNWQERVRKYEERHTPKVFVKSPEQSASDLKVWCDEQTVKNREILDYLGVRNILDDIKKDVWREGKVDEIREAHQYGNSYVKGIELKTDEFPAVFSRLSLREYEGETGSLYLGGGSPGGIVGHFIGAEIKQIRVSLGVEITAPILGIRAIMTNGPICNGSISSPDDMIDWGSSLRLKLHDPLSGGFTEDRLLFDDIMTPKTKGRIEEAIIESEAKRARLNSLPQQLRRETAKLLSMMPQEFRDRGYGTLEDFERWMPHLFPKYPWYKRIFS